MTSVHGPYPVTTYDPEYRAVVGWSNGFWWRVVDDRGIHVDGGGEREPIEHLVQLLEETQIYVDFSVERGILAELRGCDPALNSKVQGITELLVAV